MCNRFFSLSPLLYFYFWSHCYFIPLGKLREVMSPEVAPVIWRQTLHTEKCSIKKLTQEKKRNWERNFIGQEIGIFHDGINNRQYLLISKWFAHWLSDLTSACLFGRWECKCGVSCHGMESWKENNRKLF